MRIKELPKWLQEKAIANQVKQGNKPNYEIDIQYNRYDGNFNWIETLEGGDFWQDISGGGLPPEPEPQIINNYSIF